MPTAMYWAGQNYWRLYVTAKLGGQAAPGKDQMAADRAKTVERLTHGSETFSTSS